MGEIKSTLDLVMERTRHLSMSAEEKARQQQEDFAKRLQGLLQQYADGALSTDRLKDRIDRLKSKMNIHDQEPVLEAVIHRINLATDNPLWLTLLIDLVPDLGQSVANTLATFRKQKDGLVLASMARLREALSRQHGIAGSAVTPNPATDDTYLEQLMTLNQQTQARMKDLVRQAC